MRDNPKPFEIFKHFKGNRYQILSLAKDAGDGRDLVVYQALYGDFVIYVRDLAEFMSPVDRLKYPDVSQTYRFERQDRIAGTAYGVKQAGALETGHGVPRDFTGKAKQDEGQDGKEESRENFLDPAVEEFLDAESVYDKLNILAGLRHRITDDMLDIMAAASDIELNEGDTKERYAELKNCLLMTEKYECKRIR